MKRALLRSDKCMALVAPCRSKMYVALAIRPLFVADLTVSRQELSQKFNLCGRVALPLFGTCKKRFAS